MEIDPDLDYRQHPERYPIGHGERGVLTIEPYKSELLPLWRFKTPDIAEQSAADLLQRYADYKAHDDFVGMDMTRKFIQMGYTRSRRYARHRGGRKYDPETGEERPLEEEDPVKAASAQIFQQALQKIKNDPDYQHLKKRHQQHQQAQR